MEWYKDTFCNTGGVVLFSNEPRRTKVVMNPDVMNPDALNVSGARRVEAHEVHGERLER